MNTITVSMLAFKITSQLHNLCIGTISCPMGQDNIIAYCVILCVNKINTN